MEQIVVAKSKSEAGHAAATATMHTNCSHETLRKLWETSLAAAERHEALEVMLGNALTEEEWGA